MKARSLRAERLLKFSTWTPDGGEARVNLSCTRCRIMTLHECARVDKARAMHALRRHQHQHRHTICPRAPTQSAAVRKPQRSGKMRSPAFGDLNYRRRLTSVTLTLATDRPTPAPSFDLGPVPPRGVGAEATAASRNSNT